MLKCHDRQISEFGFYHAVQLVEDRNTRKLRRDLGMPDEADATLMLSDMPEERKATIEIHTREHIIPG